MFRRAGKLNKALPWSQCLKSFWREDAAQDLIEYALLTSLLALMCAAALSPVAQTLRNGVNKVEQKFRQYTHDDNGKHLGWYK
jgi:Flp pilus assembly pilin Flp